MQLTDALTLFLSQTRANGRSKHTVAQYQRQVLKLASWAGSEGLSCAIADVDHIVLARFLGSTEALLTADGAERTAVTVNVLRSCIRTFFGYLCDAELLQRNPARLIKNARCSPPPPRGLSKREQGALMRVLAKGKSREAVRDYALFRLLLATGIRVGSAVALDVGDFDFDERQMDVRVAKGNRPQRIRLGKPIAKHMVRFVEGLKTDVVFAGCRGSRLSTRHVGRRFTDWAKAAKIKRRVTAHELRHAAAVELYEKTKDIFAVQRALGHRSILSTARYAQGHEI